MKTCLTTSPILGFPQENGNPLICDTDASGFAIGGVLSQVQEGEERVIAYGSHALNPAQQHYCTTKRELYAVVYFLQHFKQYLLGRRFILRTDHAPLKWLCSFREPEGILARWLSIIGPFDFEMQYRPGRQHSNVDPLSRIPARKCTYPDCSECKVTVRDDVEGTKPAVSNRRPTEICLECCDFSDFIKNSGRECGLSCRGCSKLAWILDTCRIEANAGA